MLEEKDLKTIQNMIDTSEGRMGVMMDEKINSAVTASEARLSAMMDEKINSAITASEARLSAMMDEKINSAITASEGRMSAMMDEKIAASETRMQAYFEGAVMPKFDLLMDAFQSVADRYAPLPRVERLEENVTYLQSDVRELSRRIRTMEKAL